MRDILTIVDDSQPGPGTRTFARTRLGTGWVHLLDREPVPAIRIVISENGLFRFSSGGGITPDELLGACRGDAPSSADRLVLLHDAGD